jgi:membrane protease YdiL (CAAX protease family)
MPIGIALLILGRPAYGVARSLFKLPNWKFAVLGLFLPLTISLAISGLGYGADNARWASNDFGKYNQPLFSTYFNVALLMNGSLLFAAFSAFAEELVFRGWLLRNLTQRFGLSAGIFFAGMIWAAYHFHSDVHFRYSVQNTVVQLGLRTAVCVSMNYGLAWITLRSRSLIPAGILHTASNILIESGINLPTPWSRELRILIWCIVALVLFRYWPVTEEFSAKQGRPSSVAAALTNE